MPGAKTPEQKAQSKRADFLRRSGKPLMVLPEEMALLRTHIASLRSLGMSWKGIVDSAPGGHNDTCASKLMRQPESKVHRDVFNHLMKAQFVEPVGVKTGKKIHYIGIHRRLQALVAQGFGYHIIGPMIDMSPQAVYQIVTTKRPMCASTLARVIPVYDKLAYADPAQYGGSPLSITRSKAVAAKHEWAHAICWDDDTIDDPDSHAEYTGQCATNAGYYAHLGFNIYPICQPCKDAHSEVARANKEARAAEVRSNLADGSGGVEAA